MGEDSFDPRHWNKPSPPGGTPPPTPPQAAPEAQPRPGGTALPEAWRGIGTGFTPGDAAPPPPPPPVQSPPGAERGGVIALFGSAALLLTGAVAAWVMRTPPQAPKVAANDATATPAPTATPTPGAVQRRIVLAGVGDIAGALTAAGIAPAEAQAAQAAAAGVLGASGEIHATIDLMPAGNGFTLQRLQASYADGSGAVVTANGAGQFTGTNVAAELTKRIKVLRGELDTNSFYSSAVAAGLVDTLVPEFINAFSYDFNIASEVSPGDTFEVAFEQAVDAQGNPVGRPRLLFGSLTTKQKSLALYRYEAPGQEAGWFDGNGASTKRGLMRTPVDGARISSNFGWRFHPVLHYNKLHKGTDFAAPIGTPIYAAANGIVQWAAMKGPNGNLTILQHDKGMQTYYLHQSMFMPGVVAGAQVTQGQKIGEIGTTGRSTGPHLHFEVHLNGEPVDPLSIPADDSQRKRLEGSALQGFIAQRNRVDVARAQQAN